MKWLGVLVCHLTMHLHFVQKYLQNPISSGIKEKVEIIRAKLKSMSDGEITVSPYDTSWVALLRAAEATEDAPLFPSSLQWVIHNQFPDGSWGDQHIFLAHDRILNTLACLIALTSWDMFPDKREKGHFF